MQVRCFPVSTEEELKVCFDIRRAAFVAEQNVPADLEMDRKDSAARHFGVLVDGEIIGTCRVRLVGSAAKIERVAILKDYRGKGIGRILMRYILNEMRRDPTIELFRLSSQAYAVPFYEKLGFKTRGSEYLEAGIPHYDMVLEK
jgi:predicted GNAT family N-acyltransferase